MQEFMTYEEYLRDVKKGIVTDLGNCPVTPLHLRNFCKSSYAICLFVNHQDVFSTISYRLCRIFSILF